ncbi:bifunctional diaminohydroxyphosphoribosylaminopyrimidine deaminase/5-amino-6-(5-phosphoribosylamino)uracil reductase RibD [Neptunomonas japonica]|uniref:bifunctional diaminohydroxyphosphoribosylaminopyrimidine deaminase/5-amino-6-(5-phosphoribosylamino)uracil reductase RibD n=1 Tax=Neptunomonas japonica TaxID=417574 RepID=UPI001FE0966E|nr:bifunctional diaminohydroxyphosphoribosylaminopyrimidine deaminase/5-amino-6-(5-phosphoribosylamino)uracil reductase RibD [Neptunomonas japonica]
MPDWSVEDTSYMAEAIQLAKQGLYTTEPNPRVGCVVVKGGEVVGRGFHYRAGEGHAEVNALKQAGEAARGATAYVTLEPCSHYGRTPPCAEGLINAGIARVVSAMQDPNPEVAGRGIQMLQSAGIECSTGLLGKQAAELNPGFIKRMETGLPWVRVKLAMSLDGRTAMSSGESQWITGSAARGDVQRLRARSSAIVTGIGSIQIDDSSLTIRETELGLENATDIVKQQPLRVVLDNSGKMDSGAKILQQPGRTLWVTQGERDMPHAEVLAAQQCDGQIDLEWLLRHLASSEQCNEVLVEAGATLAGAFVEAGLVDELVVYMASTILGSNARPLLHLPLDQMNQQLRLSMTDCRQLGDDLRMTYCFLDSVSSSCNTSRNNVANEVSV